MDSRVEKYACVMAGSVDPRPEGSGIPIRVLNSTLGFWKTFGFLALSSGYVWPRQYHWRCGCKGESFDGDTVVLDACDEHLAETPGSDMTQRARMAAVSVFDRPRRTERVKQDAE